MEGVTEIAPAKVNLVLHVGPRGADGLHELCSLFASIDLADELLVEPLESGRDEVDCEPPVEGPNLALAALARYRETVGSLPPLRVRIVKRIPVAAGLAGGSADAAAALRAANRLAGSPLGPAALRALAVQLGSDVPSQVEPAHALVAGTGEQVARVELPPMAFVLVPSDRGLSTAEVYAEADRIAATRERLDPAALRALVEEAAGIADLATSMENDLQAAALSLRPELAEVRAALVERGALAALVSGSGPTVFGVFADPADAERAAQAIPNGFVARLRNNERA